MIWLVLILSPWILWALYVAVMRLQQVRDAQQLTPAMKAFGYPVLIIGLIVDFFVNAVIGSVVFWQIPHEMTLSRRLWNLSNGPAGWRHDRALWIRVQLLDAIDPSGTHRG